MTDIQTVARAAVSGGAAVERFLCHPRLPLVAGLDAKRPAIHIWDCAGGKLTESGAVAAGSVTYDQVGSDEWERGMWRPAAAWHPDQPALLVTGNGTRRHPKGLPTAQDVIRWTPSGTSIVEGLPSAARYDTLAFGPDGRTLWASPASGGSYAMYDAIDLASGAVVHGEGWDVAMAVHPVGMLATTLYGEQVATHVLFGRVDQGQTPAEVRTLARALILDADGYETPIFSADGRYLAVRGNAYEHMLKVFEFPSLELVLDVCLDELDDEDVDNASVAEPADWWRHNIAFGNQSGLLWIGTPAGDLAGVDLVGQSALAHTVSRDSPVTAVAATATGHLVVGTGTGEIVLLSVPGAGTTAHSDAERTRVAAFLDATSEIAGGPDMLEHLVVTNGERTWTHDDLETVTTAGDTDPVWLRLRAAINQHQNKTS